MSANDLTPGAAALERLWQHAQTDATRPDLVLAGFVGAMSVLADDPELTTAEALRRAVQTTISVSRVLGERS